MRRIKKHYKLGFLLFFIVIVVIAVVIFIMNYDGTKSALKKIGYSKEDATLIEEKLTEEQITTILGIEYNPSLISIINEKYYIPNNLEEYLDFSKTEKDITKIISKVNVGSNKDWYVDNKEAYLSNEYSVLVNKYNYLSTSFQVSDLVSISDWYAYAGHKTRSEVYNNYITMWKAAKLEGLTILVTSSYRTYEEQSEQYDTYGDDLASKPGSSEHQTGLALDVSTYNTDGSVFKDTKEYVWLIENSYKYGFILRYPEGKEDITGYNYEPWHYRYLGVELATKVHDSGLTFDEYHAYYCEYKGEC